MRDKRTILGVLAAFVLLLSACSSSTDSSNVAVGPGTPVPTTPPLAIPPVLAQPDQATDDEEPAVEPEVADEPTALPATAVPATAVPATAVPATAVPATAVPEVAVPAVTAVPASPQGATVALGDFDVVNLVTGATQNIAELSPSGPTMLWFWAPH